MRRHPALVASRGGASAADRKRTTRFRRRFTTRFRTRRTRSGFPKPLSSLSAQRVIAKERSRARSKSRWPTRRSRFARVWSGITKKAARNRRTTTATAFARRRRTYLCAPTRSATRRIRRIRRPVSGGVRVLYRTTTRNGFRTTTTRTWRYRGWSPRPWVTPRCSRAPPRRTRRPRRCSRTTPAPEGNPASPAPAARSRALDSPRAAVERLRSFQKLPERLNDRTRERTRVSLRVSSRSAWCACPCVRVSTDAPRRSWRRFSTRAATRTTPTRDAKETVRKKTFFFTKRNVLLCWTCWTKTRISAKWTCVCPVCASTTPCAVSTPPRRWTRCAAARTPANPPSARAREKPTRKKKKKRPTRRLRRVRFGSGDV